MDIADNYDTILAQRKMHQMAITPGDSLLTPLAEPPTQMGQWPHSSYKSQPVSSSLTQIPLDVAREDLRKYVEIDIPKFAVVGQATHVHMDNSPLADQGCGHGRWNSPRPRNYLNCTSPPCLKPSHTEDRCWMKQRRDEGH